MTKQKFKIHFQPENIEATAADGELLLDVIRAAGIALNAACGGGGTCGTCKVMITQGEVASQPGDQLSPADYERGYRLACRSRIAGDITVEIPAASRLETAVVNREIELMEATAGATNAVATGWGFKPPLTKCCLELPPASLKDNVSDLSRLLRSLRRRCHLRNISVDYDILESLPQAIRQKGGWVTVTTLVKAVKSQTERPKPTVIRVEAGNACDRHFAVAFDIGTTTVAGQLLDLSRGEVLAESLAYNGQISYGADVISRIAVAQKTGGRKKLKQAVIDTLNQIIAELLTSTGVKTADIGHLTLAGNTTMTHLLLGLDPEYIRLAPYTPVASFIPPVKAAALGINLGPHVYAFTFPSVASYVGGDIVAGVIGCGLHQRPELTLYIDIGTNGEIVIGNADWMVTTACSAGPAFEGGGITHGMIAGRGAIQGFEIDPTSGEPKVETIGGEEPAGICGSGLINIVTVLLEAGIIGQNGCFNTEGKNPRLRTGEHGPEYVIVPGHESASGEDIVITEADIDNLIRAKAAMYAGYQTLSQNVGVSLADIERVIIAGAFGSHIDIERAVTLGLLPDIPRERFVFVGNGSLTGARLTSFSTDLLNDARKVATMMTNIELSERVDFMDNYVAALFLPHTNAAEFPSVTRKLAPSAS